MHLGRSRLVLHISGCSLALIETWLCPVRVSEKATLNLQITVLLSWQPVRSLQPQSLWNTMQFRYSAGGFSLTFWPSQFCEGAHEMSMNYDVLWWHFKYVLCYEAASEAMNSLLISVIYIYTHKYLWVHLGQRREDHTLEWCSCLLSAARPRVLVGRQAFQGLLLGHPANRPLVELLIRFWVFIKAWILSVAIWYNGGGYTNHI